jgi:hypothetical protein
MSDGPSVIAPAHRVPIVVQLAAWLAAVVLCGTYGIWDAVAEWVADVAWVELGWLLLAPLGYALVLTGKKASSAPEPDLHRITRGDVAASVLIAGLAGLMAAVTGQLLRGLPAAYHDEYSYLFQAQTFLAGRWTWPQHSTHPDLFDQMHVLNETHMASRYYPGTGAWLAPWLAMGLPYLGQWVAGAIAAGLVYWIGRELAGRRAGWFAGIAFAIAPGPALFANLLLAHHATLLALMLFLLGIVRAQRTRLATDFTLAGIGLAAAMLCRPATAAGFAFPYGVWCVLELFRGAKPQASERNDLSRRLRFRDEKLSMLLGLGIPLLIGLGVMLAYNEAITGNWRTSPYQLYTDLYTPRHVYGLDNVVRGEQRIGPKVLDDYDRWAENLTPAMAWQNTLNRFLISGLWTLDLPLLVMTAVLAIGMAVVHRDRSGWLLASVIALHAIHWPYWYVGIMGWHYVFETAPLWCLLFGIVSSRLITGWWADRRVLLPTWWCGLLVIAWAGMYLPLGETWPARWMNGVASIRYPRRQHAEFRRWIKQRIGDRPALVLVDPGSQNPHLDFVVNDAGLSGPLLIGRYRPGQTDLNDFAAAFADRDVYLVRWEDRELVRISPDRASSPAAGAR